MSKIISQNDNATAWPAPEISNTGKRANNRNDLGELTERERRVVEARVNKIRQQAQQEGFEQGKKDGLAAGQSQINSAVQSLASVFDCLGNPLKHIDTIVESELVNLAVAIAKQIVRRELKTDPGQVVAVVKESLSIVPASSQRVRVYLNPEDTQLVRQIIPPNAGERTWEVIDDPVLSRGSCRVETEAAVVDATFESRIAAIAAKILGSERADD